MPRIVKKPDERRAEIIQAAGQLFLSQSYSHTSMQDVMNKVKIAKGTIYHYFKSKEELLEAVVQDIVDSSMEEMTDLVEKSKGTALEKMKLLIRKGNLAKENQELLSDLHSGGNEGVHIRLLAVALVKQSRIYEQVIRQGCEEGTFQTENPLEAAEFILSGFQFLTDLGIYPWSQEDLKRRVKAFPKLIEKQLNAPPGSFRFLSKT
jgi:AcrR family transcriptional regulator